MDIVEVVSKNIRMIRNMHSHSLKYVADYVGIGQSTLSRMENRISPINIEVINSIADLYEIDPHLILIDPSDNIDLYKRLIKNKTKINITLEDLVKCKRL